MKNIFTSVFATVALLGGQAFATPVVVNPTEKMIVVPGLEFLGASRISTVEFCSTEAGVSDWTDLQTDSEFEGMEKCLIEMT